MAKNLTDLTARTATADSDLLHINSGGTDYKESKSNFLCGDFNHVFANNTLLTTQADALPSKPGVYHGYCAASGHQTELGIPINNAIYITVKFWVANYGEIDIQDVANPENAHYVLKKVSGTWDSTWTRIPARAEITSINNSLTNSLRIGTPVSVQVSLSALGMQTIDVSDLANPPSISGYVHQYWELVSSTYRFSPVGYGGTRVYYWVGTTSTSPGSMVCYPIYKKS